MRCSMIPKCVLAGLLILSGVAHAAVVATFDNLPTAPALDSGTGLQFANNNSLVYAGITWDSRFTVVGDEYRVNTNPLFPTPLFGIPRSPRYFVTNQDGVSGLTINTGMVLTGASFGRNQYYGFSEGGADQVTIVALAGLSELAAVVFDLPDNNPGLAEPLSFVDTSVFGGLAGITGYRIDRRELGQQAGNWVADDFQFRDARVLPAPGVLALFGVALLGLAIARRRRTW